MVSPLSSQDSLRLPLAFEWAKESSGSDQWDATQYHKVKKGDTGWKIAEDYYDDRRLYPKIFEADRDILRDANVIKGEQKLRIP